MEKSDRLVWIDLEMTGLSPVNNRIVEIAVIITDDMLTVIAESESIVIHVDESELIAMDPYVINLHKKSGLYEKILQSTVFAHTAEEIILEFLRLHVKSKDAPLCGNSVWMDRWFLSIHMPQLYDFLHYRTIDVSTIKELIRRWYPKSSDMKFKKDNNHRALDDIRESIAELRHYKTFFFIQKLL